MTFRAKPTTTKRRRRTHWESEERTQLLATVAFIGVVLLALLILGGAVAAQYYDQHFKAIARVEGTDITRDQWQQRQKVATFRLDREESHLREELAAGTVDSTTANSQISSIDNKKQSVATDSLEALIDQTLQAKIAPKIGVSVSPSDIDAALNKDATRPETRHVFLIAVEPARTGDAEPTAQQKQAAKDRADKALVDLKAGKSFADVAKTYSTDSSKENDGDVGYINAEDTTDKAWVAAVFKLKEGGTSDVIAGGDGTYRIGRVDQVIPAVTDPNYPTEVDKAVGLAPYRDALMAEQLKQKLEDYVSNQALTGDVEQVHAYEILVQIQKNQAGEQNSGPEAHVRHILYSPKDDPQGAAQLSASDPAWTTAQKEAADTASKLNAIKDVAAREKAFVEFAKKSDDTGSGATGGELPWFGQNSDFVEEFKTAVLSATHQKGDVIGPVKSQFGYHVIMFEATRPPPDKRIDEVTKLVKAPGANFQQIAKDNSDAPDASKGGDMGWIAHYQLDKQTEEALFRLQAGQISDAQVKDDGYHIYKVQERTKRPVDASQRSTIEANAFTNWYQPQKDAANIYRDPSVDAGS